MNNPPAFPAFDEWIAFTDEDGIEHKRSESHSGITTRDYFAAHAPAMPEQWYLDHPRKKSNPLWHWGAASAEWAFFYADAMMEAREHSSVKDADEPGVYHGGV